MAATKTTEVNSTEEYIQIKSEGLRGPIELVVDKAAGSSSSYLVELKYADKAAAVFLSLTEMRALRHWLDTNLDAD